MSPGQLPLNFEKSKYEERTSKNHLFKEVANGTKRRNHRKDSGDIRFFTDEETQAFLKSLREGYDIHYPRKYRKNGRIIPAHDRHIDVDTQWIVYFNLAIYAGCRRGELLALTWKDIDFKTRTITIEKARARTKAGDITKKPKNKHSIRTITVPADCIHLLIL